MSIESGHLSSLADLKPRSNGRLYPPGEPSLAVPHRARVVLNFTEQGEEQHAAEDGWARLDGPWLMFLGDETQHWQSWPAHAVVCVDWFHNGEAERW